MFGSKKDKNKKKDEVDAFEEQLRSGQNDLLQDIDMSQIDKMMKNEIKEDDISLTEDDMNDPELLAQLGTIESGSTLERPKPTPAPNAASAPSPMRPSPQQQQQQQQSKKPAKALTPEEEEELALRREMGEMDSGDDDDNDMHDGGEDDFQAMIPILEQRVVAYKKTALANKDNRELALKYMKAARQIEEAVKELNQDIRSLPPDLQAPAPSQRSAPVATTTTTTTKTTSPKPTVAPVAQVVKPPVPVLSREEVDRLERAHTWELFEAEYTKKHNSMAQEAIRLKNNGELEKSLMIVKEIRGVNAVLEQIRVCNKAGVSPPPFHFEERVTQTEVIQGHLKENQIEFIIGKYEFPKSLGTLDSYITTEFPYPSSEEPQKFTTASSNSATGKDYSFKTVIEIEKKKSFQRIVEKKKLVLTINSSKMFFMKTVVGKCEVKLADLLDRCEINTKFPIMKDGSKKELGGYVEVAIRMRTPIASKEYIKKSERILVLDGPLQNVDVTAVAAPTTPATPTTTTPSTSHTTSPTATSTTPQQPERISPVHTPPTTTPTKPTAAEVHTPTSTTTTTSTTKTPVAATPSPTPKPAESTPTEATGEEEEEEEWDSLDRIVSNDVMESMLAVLIPQVATKPTPELIDRKQALEIKMMVLETQVSSGMLTIEAYTKQLENAVLQDKILAKKLVGAGKKDVAIKVMARIKIMNAELASASQAS
ncbi:hypothetical protein SAMD00019534_033450 [Acytostelium subglobosum LB1]|uniref:hypothetical protein n=1 Tax=Acytostelium subglobosum LB1 TaxID=1410327 RepID=UPI000644B671|nr:hypothetical protein SAMD00019534_033450 [Acytostelium subglobosum LB1]GAM20170.1 hypothetical protein SAMD00019534_033450 [Acytostelium subglobosum LB1]|eukprot:XP_012759691.1 hypothetical protein SAMD00019534_033450 [Acytostelium subglobosum LB1]